MTTTRRTSPLSMFNKLVLGLAALLAATACGVDVNGAELERTLEQRTQSLEVSKVCSTSWGHAQVRLQADTITSAPDLCQLFDGYTTDAWAVIAGNGSTPTRLDITFLTDPSGVPLKRTLTGFHTYVGGYSDMAASNAFTVNAICDEPSVTFPDYRGYANKPVALGFRSACTASTFSLQFWRNHYDGLEHIAELTPIFLDAGTPVTGDHDKLLTDTNVNRCASPVLLSATNIVSTSGAVVGTINLFRARCTRQPSNTAVDVYFAQAKNANGLPGAFGSVYVQATFTSGIISRVGKSVVTTPSAGATSIRGNVFADENDPSIASVAACARFYPDATTLTAAATSAGCTANVAL